MTNTTLEQERKQRAIQYLRSELENMSALEAIRSDLLSVMIVDWITNEDPEEPAVTTAEQMKELIEDQYTRNNPTFQLDEQDADNLLNVWRTFVRKYYSSNEGGRRKKTRKTRKSKKRSKRTRKH